MLGRRQSPDSADSSSDESSGSIPHLLRGLQEYLAARTELLGIESAEASQFAKQQALHGIILAVAALFGYSLLLVAVIAIFGAVIAPLLPSPLNDFGWHIIAIAAGSLHFLLAFRMLRKLRRPPGAPLFEVTRSEFQKDRQWIKDQQDKNESSS